MFRTSISPGRRVFSFRRALRILSLLLASLLITSLTMIDNNRSHQFQDAEVISANQSIADHQAKLPNTSSEDNCDETIHLGIVCGGFNSARDLYVLLKSVLFYRTNRIHLYVFVDNISRVIFEKLFETWRVPDLDVTLINMTTYEQEIAWIPSQHYSRRYGLMKLVFMSALIEQIQERPRQVILLDTDMLALGNINRAWHKFKEVTSSQADEKLAIGIVENQSDWYLNDEQNNLSGGRIVWPALGRGFNTGFMIVNLDKLEKLNWGYLWRQVTETQLISHLTTTLADQDIINAVIREHRDIVYSLPCTFNLQLNDHAKLDHVCPSVINATNDLILVHWNSPNKLETHNPSAAHFKSWYLNFRNWDGSLLRRRVCYLTSVANAIEEDTFDSALKSANRNDDESLFCAGMRPRFDETLRTFLYFMPFEIEQTDEFDVTIVVHLSIDRLRVLNDLALHWRGPISAAIYLTEMETNLLLSSIQDGENLAGRKNIGYHLVFRDFGFNYPINRLRNVAADNAITPYVFLSDIDFLPNPSLYDELRTTIREFGSLNRRALVVPAFENLQYKFEFPASKAELIKQLNLGTVSMFREQIWPRGHLPTDYARWRVSTRPYTVEWQPDYEPFIVVDRRNLTRFDERFVGFGWNKVEHTMELAAQGYEFLVLPETFVIHQFHSASYDIIKHRESIKYRACIRHMKRVFLSELSSKHPEFFERLSSSTTVAPMGANNQPIRRTKRSSGDKENSTSSSRNF